MQPKILAIFLTANIAESFFFADERVYFEIKNGSSKGIDFDAKKLKLTDCRTREKSAPRSWSTVPAKGQSGTSCECRRKEKRGPIQQNSTLTKITIVIYSHQNKLP
jgi:hypothetical protein